MCDIAAFIITRCAEHWDPSDSHDGIITRYSLEVPDRPECADLVRVEMLPPDDLAALSDPQAWRYRVDQDEYPEWTFGDDPNLERRARAALAQRIEEDRIGAVISGDGRTEPVWAGPYGTATAGHYGTATAGHYGSATSGFYGTSTSGFDGTSTSGHYGTSTSGHYGTSTSGNSGTSTSGNSGTSTSGDRGTSTSGDRGTSIAGFGGKATAGVGGHLAIARHDGQRVRLAVAYVGEGGIEPNVPYRLDGRGNFVRAD